MMLLISVSSEIDTFVVLESTNVAISVGPLGTVIGVQLAAVFQSPDVGLRFHWALSAYTSAGKSKIREQRIAVPRSVFMVICGLKSTREITAGPSSLLVKPNSFSNIDVKFPCS